MHVCVYMCVCVCVCVCVYVCVCVCVGYWPREKLLQHAQFVAQQEFGVQREGHECGLRHPSLLHLFVGFILIAIFGLFAFFVSCFPFCLWFYLNLPSALPHLDRHLWSFSFIFSFFFCYFSFLFLFSAFVRGPHLDRHLWSCCYNFFVCGSICTCLVLQGFGLFLLAICCLFPPSLSHFFSQSPCP